MMGKQSRHYNQRRTMSTVDYPIFSPSVSFSLFLSFLSPLSSILPTQDPEKNNNRKQQQKRKRKEVII